MVGRPKTFRTAKEIKEIQKKRREKYKEYYARYFKYYYLKKMLANPDYNKQKYQSKLSKKKVRE